VAAAASSTRAAFRCTTWSISATAVLTLLDPAALLLRRRRDVGDQRVDLLHRLDDRVDLAAGGSHFAVAGFHLSRRIRDQPPYFPGRLGAALRTACGPRRRTTAKPATCLARAGGFHRRVQRQQVGLEGDAVDHADDLVDLARRRRMPPMVRTTCCMASPPFARDLRGLRREVPWRAARAPCSGSTVDVILSWSSRFPPACWPVPRCAATGPRCPARSACCLRPPCGLPARPRSPARAVGRPCGRARAATARSRRARRSRCAR
jgi:hypothetical protein